MRTMRRWSVRILLGLLALLLLGAIVIQIVLATDVPRRLVLNNVERSLGLRIGAESLDTGWAGHTSLQNITLSLPLASDSFLKVKALRIKHTPLPGLLAGRPLKLTSMEFDEPELLVQQDALGRWNVAEVIDLLRRALGGKQAAESVQPQKPETAQIPRIVLKDGTIRIIDRTQRTAVVYPVSARGQPDGPLVWRYEATAGPPADPHLQLIGKLAPGASWSHAFDLHAAHLEPSLRPWLVEQGRPVRRFIGDADSRTHWDGQFVNGSLIGRATLNQFRSGSVSAAGSVAASYAAGKYSFRPSNLVISGIPGAPSDFVLASGELTIEGTTLGVSNLRTSGAHGELLTAGSFDWARQAGQATTEWHDLVAPGNITQDGSIALAIRNDFPGLRRVELTLRSNAASPRLGWNTQVAIEGAGKTFAAFDWTATATKLSVTRGNFTSNLDGLHATLAQTPQRLTLTSLTVPAGQLAPNRPRGTLAGQGYYSFPAKGAYQGGDWWLLISGADWRLSDQASITTSFSADLSGDTNASDRWLRIDDFYAATSTGIRTWAAGHLAYAADHQPATLALYTWYPPFTLEAYDAGQVLRGGQFLSELHAAGHLQPLNLKLTGKMDGKDLVIHNSRRLGDIELILDGSFASRPTGPGTGGANDYVLSLDTQKLKLLGADWDIRGTYSTAAQAADLDVSVHELSLAQLDDFLSPPSDFKGTAQGAWKIHAPHLDFAYAAIDSTEPIRITGFKAGQTAADQITGELHANHGTVRIERIRALRTAGGQIDGQAEFRLKEPARMKIKAVASAWPIALPNGSALVYGQTSDWLTADFSARQFSGPFKLDVYPTYRGTDLGAIRTEGNVARRAVTFTKISGADLGGTITGTASYDFDDLLKARASLQLRDFQGARIVPLVPQLKDLAGRFSGSIELGAAKSPRPLGPMQLDLKFAANDARWRTISIKSGDFTAYYNPASGPEGDTRFVMDNSYLTIADGDVRVFARATRHTKAANPGESPPWNFDFSLNASNLDLNQLVHAGGREAHDMPGRLAGRVNLLGNPRDAKLIVGQGSVQLTDSDLAESNIISFLYGVMSIRIGPKVPTGKGSSTFRLDGTDLNITSAYYFNRGVEARGTGVIHDVWKGGDADVTGYVIGSARPLKDLKLPFAADVDKILAVIQKVGGVTTVKVGGKLHNPTTAIAPFSEIGQSLRELLLGDVSPQTKSTAGQ